MCRREANDEEEEEDERDSELPIAQSVHILAGKAEVVDEYESDPDEVKHSLVMRRGKISDDEEDETEFECGAPAEYDDEEEDEEEHDRELEEEDEEGDVYEDKEVYEEEERNDGAIKVKRIKDNDARGVRRGQWK
ncbi:hypothetical protein CICLE_v10003114mg [Citrus x clementina]|uniref:Uncharacterized protein n=1 Tax=Citrus clementina TaxID=85681 RepID=V4T910_CITCL|nr:hypothetical protein CICLE_v10003114mg [Citrus x clementina]